MPKPLFFYSIFSLVVMAPAASAADMAALRFCIPPQQSPTELTKRWTPVLQYLSQASEVELHLKTAKDIPTYQQSVMDGHCDIAYMSPNSYVAANKASGYLAFAKEKGGKSAALLVARKDGPVTHVSQLNGQTLAFPSKTAFMATILPVMHLQEEKINFNTQYVISIDSVYRAVARGLFVAGGAEARTFGVLEPEIRDQLTVLWQSDDLPPFPFFAHPRVPPTVLKKLLSSMLAMGNDLQAQPLLKAINIKAWDRASDAEYDGIRKMNLPLEVKIEIKEGAVQKVIAP